MAINDTSLWASVRTAATQSHAATTNQIAALKNELTTDPTGRGYKDSGGAMKGVPDLVLLINDGYSTANPTGQGSVARATASKNDFGVFMGTAMGRVLNSGNSALVSKWTGMSNSLLPFVNLQDAVPLSSATVQGILSGLVTDTVITQAESDAFARVPDPAYQPTLPQPSRASGICGVAEASDIAAALV